MLQTTPAQQNELQEYQESQAFDPRQYLTILGKRKFYLLVPLILVLALGVTAALLWPPTYLSEGKILVESQQIPTDLVRPTITATAKERVQVIQQRVTTRENLLGIADKYKIFAGRSDSMSRTDMLDQMRENIVVEPIELDKTPSRNLNPTVAMKVGFMDRHADVATKVANELLTLFLNEDARNRTNRAMETTRFLAREVQKIEADLKVIDDKLAEAQKQGNAPAVYGS